MPYALSKSNNNITLAYNITQRLVIANALNRIIPITITGTETLLWRLRWLIN